MTAHRTNDASAPQVVPFSREKASRRRLTYSDLAEAYEQIGAERDWFAEGAIEGAPMVVLSGPEKRGKSWAAADLAVCAVLGAAWLGAFPLRRTGDVVVIDGEYGSTEYARRLARLARGRGAAPAEVFGAIRHHDGRGFSLDRESELVRDLGHELKEDPPALVIIDPLRNFLPGDENNAGDVIDALHVVAALRQLADCPVVVVHHLNKQGSMSGSRAIRTRADVLIDGSDDDEPCYSAVGRTLRSADRITSPFQIEVAHENDEDDTRAATTLTARFEGDNGRATTKQLSAAARRILEALRRLSKPTTGNALGKIAGVSSGTTRTRALEELKAAGLVDFRDGRWGIATSEFFAALQAQGEVVR